MVAVFDAALDGDQEAVRAALSVCTQCPMIHACEDLRRTLPDEHRLGVMAGEYLSAPEFFADLEDRPVEAGKDPATVLAMLRSPQERQARLGVAVQDELPLEWTAALDVAA